MIETSVAIVTGAAQGIGAAITERLLADGYTVVAIDINGDTLCQFRESLVERAERVLPLIGDLGDICFVLSIAGRVQAEYGRIDLLVNNAAWREVVTMREIAPESWERSLRVCLTAPAFLSREAANYMDRGGVIINIGSMMADQAAGFAPAYVASKGALQSLTHDLAALYGPQGIRVININPGPIRSSLSDGLADGQCSSEEALRKYGESMTMLGRFGTPQEIADAVAWIASREASFLTGTSLTIDGGWSRHHFPTQLAQRLFEATSE